MAARSAWKGFLRLSLVSVPLKAYTANPSGGGEIHLNQLHKECNSRINYKKTCPVHGEIPNDEIVSGYEYSKGQYVIVDKEEVEKLRTEDDKAIKIDAFVSPTTFDVIYFTGKNYHLVPDGPIGQKPYAVLVEAMTQEKKHAVAKVVMHGREQTVLLRSVDGMLTMSILNYEHQVTKGSTFHEEITKPEIASQERQLAKTLVEAATAKKFDYSTYTDLYTERLTKLIEAKVAGEEIVTPPAHEEAQVINLMDALKQSVERMKGAGTQQKGAGKPPKRMAASKSGEERARKRKTS
jgi:DNA end-binding protein Ku